MRWSNRNALFIVVVFLTGLSGCAYRLHAPMLPVVYRVKVVADLPERYTVRLLVVEPHEYGVPADGRLNIAVPGYRAPCSVYLFDKLHISREANPFTEKRVEITDGRKIVRRLSLREVVGLPLDVDRCHLLTIAGRQ